MLILQRVWGLGLLVDMFGIGLRSCCTNDGCLTFCELIGACCIWERGRREGTHYGAHVGGDAHTYMDTCEDA